MKYIFILFLSVSSLTVFGQKTVNDANAQKRNVSSFHAISVSGGIDLYLSQGDEAVAVSAAEDKFVRKIHTEVENGVLKIWYDDNKNFTIDFGNRKLRAYVSFRNLDQLTASGGSDVEVDGSIKTTSLVLRLSGGCDFKGRVDVDDLSVNASGGSDVDISGTAKNNKVDVSGGSDFKGFGLATDICSVEASGGSDIYITVNNEIKANASGGSDIRYKGNGVIKEIRSSGSSSIKKSS